MAPPVADDPSKRQTIAELLHGAVDLWVYGELSLKGDTENLYLGRPTFYLEILGGNPPILHQPGITNPVLTLRPSDPGNHNC